MVGKVEGRERNGYDEWTCEKNGYEGIEKNGDMDMDVGMRGMDVSVLAWGTKVHGE